jgi:hypothetical protein
VRKRLEDDDAQVASSAAYVMSQRGPAGDAELIEARLKRWEREWGSRGAELDARCADEDGIVQSMTQVNMIESLLVGKAWRLPEEKVKQLK